MKRSNFTVVVFGLVTAAMFGSQSNVPTAQAADLEAAAPLALALLAPAAVPGSAASIGAGVPGDVHANLGTKASATPPSYETSGSCAAGMVEVEGDYCPFIEQKCLRWLDPEPTISRTLDRLLVENPDDLDVLILANPLELTLGHDPPASPVASPGDPQ